MESHGTLARATHDRVLDLSGCQQLSQGSEKRIFLHPENPAMLVKVRDFRRVSKQRFQRFHQWALDRSERHRLRWLVKEIEESVVLVNKEAPPDCPVPAAVVIGQVITSMGPAAVTPRVGREKRLLAPSLRKIIENGHFGPKHIEALNEFVDRADQWNLSISDLDLSNLVYGTWYEDRRFVLIDGFGDYSLVGWRHWSQHLNQALRGRKFRLLARNIGLTWDHRTRTFRA